MKKLAEKKQLLLSKKENKISISFTVEFLFEKTNVEIDLFPEKANTDDIIKHLCKEINLLKEEIKVLKMNKKENLENENKELKNSIENIKKENISLKEEIKEIKKILEPINNKFKEKLEKIEKKKIYNKSVIMKENEFNSLINYAIIGRLNKEIKELKKLYQATIDGDRAIDFHRKCDKIPNTLVLVKSAGNRRFGGFTTQSWDFWHDNKKKNDDNAFLFSLDKKQIYSHKKGQTAIICNPKIGPYFGDSGFYGFYLNDNSIKEKALYTNESYSNSNSNYSSFDFNGDNNALSEDGKGSGIYATEYEIFQVIFS